MAMMEKCAEETQELKELKDFLEGIGGCITDDTLYSMRTILQGMVKWFNCTITIENIGLNDLGIH